MRLYYDQPNFTRSWAPAAMFEFYSNIIGNTDPFDTPLLAQRMGVRVEGRVLTKDETTLAKKFKLQGLSEDQRLSKLSAAADASGDRDKFLRTMGEKYKLGEEEGRALRAALSVGDKYQTGLAELRGTKVGSLNERFNAAVMNDPIASSEYETRRAREVAAAQKEMSGMGDFARAQRAKETADTMAWQRNMPTAIGALGMNGEGGLNFFGRTMTNLSKMGAPPETYQQAEARLKSETIALSEQTGRELVESLKALKDSTDKNSGATEANSKATAGTGGDGSFGGPIDRNAEL